MSVLGIDIGSTVAKFAVIGQAHSVEQLYSFRVHGDPIECIKFAIQTHESLQGHEQIAVTGSSRNLVAQYLDAKITKPEILAHIYGVLDFIPTAKTIIEIGGQDSKLIFVNKGVISDFKMNSICAAGTGAFIEAQATRLGMSIEQMDALAMESDNPLTLNTKCAIFLESAVINLQKNGVKKKDIVMTIFNALANNYVTTLCKNLLIKDDVVFIGGVAKLQAMKKSFETILSKKIICPLNCDYMGAIGVAFLLQDEFIYDSNEKIPDITQCKGCINRCLLNIVTTESGIIYSGGLCDKNHIERIVKH